MRSERAGPAPGCPGMETSMEYKRFAEECRRLAREAKTEQQPPGFGGNGASLGEARQGGRAKRPSAVGLIIRSLLGIVLLCQAQPYLRHLQQRRPRFRVLDGVCHIRALLDVAPILVGTPHAASASAP